jgi:hypothetical protein
MQVKMSLGHSVGGRSFKVPPEVVYTRLEADASEDNPYSFIAHIPEMSSCYKGRQVEWST